jgi:hypothetical protein
MNAKLGWGSIAINAICIVGCSGPVPETSRVAASFDKSNGRLSQLTVDATKDGKPNIYSYMNGTKFIRIEIDNDEDGKIDRWEYYGPNQKIEKVGVSRANNGKPDAWMFENPDSSVRRIEISTRHDGKVNRVEFYDEGVLARAEEDGNGDGRPDKWETYESGALATAAFDTKHSGVADRTIDYRNVEKK